MYFIVPVFFSKPVKFQNTFFFIFSQLNTIQNKDEYENPGQELRWIISNNKTEIS